MAQRTYLIGLFWAAFRLYRYMTRWQDKAVPNMTAPQQACFDALLVAVTECVAMFQPATPVE